MDQNPVEVSPSRFRPLVEIHEEIRGHGFCAELVLQSGYLAPMVAGMIDYVDQLLPEQIGIAAIGQRAPLGASLSSRLSLIPARGPVSFSEVTHNQVFVVPRQLSADLRRYIFKRKALMQQIEQRDVQELERNPPPP